MGTSLIFISGASSGIGDALSRNLPWEPARVVGISRSKPGAADEHVAVDLADPATWPAVGQAFEREVAGGEWDRVVFVHAAGNLDPIGFAREVDADAYQANVLLNSAAPQVLGHLFLAATEGITAPHHVVMITSGAAKSVYPGWSSYGAAKAAVDQWVRNVGAEQDIRGGAKVIAVAPGTVDTDMQAMLRSTTDDDFPKRQKFVDIHAEGKLADPDEVARDIWSLLDRDLDNGTVLDLRDV
ncbi:MAG: SDR family NAD(P)-dependent oxidoreductase [Acidimicrobiales bacterium]